jgi:hypothetical protein
VKPTNTVKPQRGGDAVPCAHVTRRASLLPAILATLALAGLVSILPGTARAQSAAIFDEDIAYHALHALPSTPGEQQAAVKWLAEKGDSRAVAPLIQLLRWQPDGHAVIQAGLERITHANLGENWFDWFVWQQEHTDFPPYDGFGNFLALALAAQDPQFLRFVHQGVKHDIRLEEIVWGGVRVDGIPALDNPKMISAVDEAYLSPDDLVFGIEIAGDARAYPLRIMNWHEMLNDTVGGVPVSLAYCTLCGAGILFDGRVPGRPEPFTFGTSGLLYRSNKLMYDRATDSLWSQFNGRPVMGPLTGSNIELKVLPLATAPWKVWRAKHPNTKVLAIDTGFNRNYAGDVAYKDYFASKDLLFPAATRDHRLQPKDVVFGLRAAGGTKAWPLTAFAGGKIINDKVGFVDVVVVGNTEQRTVRAFEAKGHKFTPGNAPDLLRASDGYWRITEDGLIASDGRTLARLPGHLAYWFAWSGYFENANLGGN